MNKRVLFKKLLQSGVTVAGVLVINFFLFRVMPGDPASMLVRNPRMNAQSLERVTKMFGLDKPLTEQFFLYVRDLSHGELGTSFIFKKPVILIIGERVVSTLLLTVLAEFLAIVIGVLVGILAAWKRGTTLDVAALTFTLVSYSMPTFWLGIIMVAIFAGGLGLFPVSGMISPALVFAGGWVRAMDVANHLILPTVTLALVLAGEYALIMRNSMIEVLTEDYITTARAVGLSESDVLKKHALPNALIPMSTVIAMSLGFTITGALQVETVFSWPGLGRLMYDALKGRDYPLLQGIFLITSIAVIGANFVADILYRYIDPRVSD